MSPRPGISILITSAPIQASSWGPVGPAWPGLRARMRTPSRALLIVSLTSVFCHERGRHETLVEKIAMLLDMRGEPERVLARQPFGEFGVAAFQRLDDPHMVDDRAGRAIVLVDRDLADRAHVDEQVFRRLGEQLAAAHPYNRLVKGDVRIGIFG